ncbi:hypothetical protein GCM10009535_56820 [Streptomyces thermocarboxydovorans]|uniref:Adenylosuccinate lyase C-terminal domain-containing protein n=2 Tax=Streptomyces thermocarboxydovorans TaxID=59298 RepID=A0ABN1HVJ1_9ACTN
MIPLADGKPHPTGYWPEEVLRPYERFIEAGVEVVIATPHGRSAQPDPWGLEPKFAYPDEAEDFMGSVIRSFADDADNIRITLHHLTELNLIASKRIFSALTAAGLEYATARGLIEAAAKVAWREDRDLLDVLEEDAQVNGVLTRDQLDTLAAEVQADSAAEARKVAEALDSIDGLRHPVDLDTLSDEQIRGFDAVFFPGGHGPMVDLYENPHVARVLDILHAKQAVIAALCHGPAALLAAGNGPDGVWLFDGYKMTAFTDEEEEDTPYGQLGARWYLETELKNRGAVFDDADAPWTSHVIVDRNLITAQNPASSDAAADAILKRLEVL